MKYVISVFVVVLFSVSLFACDPEKDLISYNGEFEDLSGALPIHFFLRVDKTTDENGHARYELLKYFPDMNDNWKKEGHVFAEDDRYGCHFFSSRSFQNKFDYAIIDISQEERVLIERDGDTSRPNLYIEGIQTEMRHYKPGENQQKNYEAYLQHVRSRPEIYYDIKSDDNKKEIFLRLKIILRRFVRR